MRMVLLRGQVWPKNKKPKQSAFWLLIIIMILLGQYMSSSVNRMINLYVAAAPHFSGGPVRIFIGPERVRNGKAQRQEYGAAQVQASHIDIALRQFGLASADSRLQPAILIKHFLVFHTSADNRSQCTADLGRLQRALQTMFQRGLGQHLKSAETIADGTSKDWIASVRRDHPFQNGGITCGPDGYPFSSSRNSSPRFTNISARSKYMGWITKLL